MVPRKKKEISTRRKGKTVKVRTWAGNEVKHAGTVWQPVQIHAQRYMGSIEFTQAHTRKLARPRTQALAGASNAGNDPLLIGT